MPYKIIITDIYRKKAWKFFKKHPEFVERHEKIFDLLKINPFHPSLKLHPLQGNMKGMFAISLNVSYRVSLDFIIEDKTITPLNIGDHDAVYS